MKTRKKSVKEGRTTNFSWFFFYIDWEQRKVNSIAEKFYGGGTPSTLNEELWQGDIAWIQSSDLIEHNVLDVVIRKRINEKAIKTSATQLIPPNSIAIITRVGVGKVAYMPISYATSQDFVSLSELNILSKSQKQGR